MSEIRANNYVDNFGLGAPNFPYGVTIAGVTTATSFVGDGSNLTSVAASSATGDFTITNGNVVISNGYGIDFSAGIGSVTSTSQLLDDYEEGTWTPTEFYKNGFTGNLTVHNATYTKIGNIVQINLDIEYATSGAAQTGWRVYFTGLPFAPAQTTPAYGENSDNTSSVILWRAWCTGNSVITYVVVLAGAANGASRFRLQANYFV